MCEETRRIGSTPTETRTELGSMFSRLKLVLEHHMGTKCGAHVMGTTFGVLPHIWCFAAATKRSGKTLYCSPLSIWSGVKFFPQLGSRARVTQVTQQQVVWKRKQAQRAQLTWSFLLLCPSDLSTALLLLSSWTACLSWDFSSALTLRT